MKKKKESCASVAKKCEVPWQEIRNARAAEIKSRCQSG